jgi:tetratricopeptide (TPR) repeat protein
MPTLISQVFTMYQVAIDASEETVTLRQQSVSKEFRHQWVPFYLALALRVDSPDSPSPFLEPEELQLFGDWFFKKPESIGKEVARHLQDLSRHGLAGFIVDQGKTRRWRLGLLHQEISFLPSREQCEVWLRQQQWDLLGGLEKIPSLILTWISHTTRALIRLQEGRIKEGLELAHMAKQKIADSVLLGAIAELVELRLHARVGNYPEPEEWEYLARCEGNIGKTLLIRASLAQSLAPDFENIETAIESLRKLTFRLQSLPDINGLGTSYNALGVLFRRNGQLDLSEKCLRYAVALLIASFDIPTLQASLFNLGHTLYRAATDDEALSDALRLVELDREICHTLGLGKDSAQGEIVAGEICLKLGDIPKAEQWLQEGRKIVQTLNSDYNKAGIELLHARILWVQAWKGHPGMPKAKEAILAKYREALDLLSRAGFPLGEVEQEMALLQRGERPTWIR